jgi:pimeloyl-ACP methyl ester carboxylesterase
MAALEQQFCVWTIDRRGRGRSGDLDDYALEHESEDIAAVIDAIGRPVHLLGHSFGGLCALEAALLTPNIGSLILYEPPISLAGSDWPSAFDAHLQALLDSGNREEAVLFFFREIVKSPPHELAALQAGPSWPGRLAGAHTILRELRSVSDYRFDARRFAALALPVLLLLGGESPHRRAVIAETLHRSLSRSQIAVLQQQQHSAMRTAPDLFVREILTFLNLHGGSTLGAPGCSC